MRTTIDGSIFPVLRVMLEAGERLVAETGELAWKTPNVTLSTTTTGAGMGGLFGAVRRSLAGGGLFMTEFTAEQTSGLVAFATRLPGHILEHQVGGGRAMLVHRHGFLCATPGVTLDLAMQRSLGAGIFGGDGFRLQRVAGHGTFWSMLGGEIIPHDLAPGEVVDVHPGLVGMFEDTVSFDVTMLPGIRNKLFGDNGFFMARLTGPGRVWLQTLTMPGLAHALSPYMGGEKATAAAEGSLVGAALSGLLRQVR